MNELTRNHIFRIARVTALAVEAMGGEYALAWLYDANHALGDRVPIELLNSDEGAQQVERIIGRIEHGIFS